MKKLKLIAVAITLVFASCSDAMDSKKCLESVAKTFPNSTIYQEAGCFFTFYVVDSSGIKIVSTGNWTNTNINGIRQLSIVK